MKIFLGHSISKWSWAENQASLGPLNEWFGFHISYHSLQMLPYKWSVFKSQLMERQIKAFVYEVQKWVRITRTINLNTEKGKKILLKTQSKCRHSFFASCWSNDGPSSSHPGILTLLRQKSKDKVWLEEAGLRSPILLLEYPLCLIKISTVCSILWGKMFFSAWLGIAHSEGLVFWVRSFSEPFF